MDSEDKKDHERSPSEEFGMEAGPARPAPPPPAGLDPAEDTLFIDPDDPLFIPVPLGDGDDPIGERVDDGPVGPAEAPHDGPPPPPPDSLVTEPGEAPIPAAATALEQQGDDESRVSVTAGEAGGREEANGPPPGKRRHKKALIGIAALLGVAVLGLAGIAYAGYDYSQKYEGRILPGATVAGVDVGGMSPEEALGAVKEAIRPQLTRTIEVTWEDHTWTVTPKELGAQSNARAAVEDALNASSDTSFFEKTRMRVLGDQLSFTNDVAIAYPREGARGFIQGLAANLHREPRDAALDYSTGWVEVTSSRRGRDVNVGRSLSSLRDAMLDGSGVAELSVRTIEPEVTEEAYEKVLLVRIGENKLYLYEDGKITHEYLVATGQSAYPTPTGVYEITEKRYMPTWVNPAPDGWGKSMPASIPPGISNPLGLRALNWSASGIRFHGTTATYSLGYNASHGCVRMANEDVIELYDMVDVGTPIVSLESAAYNPLIEESSESEPTAENSAN